MDEDHLRITSATPDDKASLAAICLKTAAAGQDASALFSDPALPGHFWVMPYAEYEPELAFVLRDGDRVLGYVVGTRDTAAFRARLAQDWWPPLRERYKGFAPQSPDDERAMAMLAEPEPADPRLAPYPAHLHINLLPEAQRGGWGRRLIERELGALASAGAEAVHLGLSVKNAPVAIFYGKLGFERLFQTETGIYMGRRL